MRNPGEVTVRRLAGVDADEWGSAAVGNTIPDVAAQFLADQRLIVISARDERGDLWATLLTGAPGFVRVEDESSLILSSSIPAGDPLADSFAAEGEIGMLAIEPSTRRRMRINGRAQVTGGHLRVSTEQVYSNCPKYIQTRTPIGELDETPGEAVVTTTLSDDQRQWVASADTFFVGSGAGGHGLDVSHRGGNPGFIETHDDGRIGWPDYVGNSMYMTLGNLELDSRAGLLFIGWDSGQTLHMSGRASIDWDQERARRHPGAQRMVDFQVDRVVQIEHRAPMRWHFDKYSRFNPSLEDA